MENDHIILVIPYTHFYFKTMKKSIYFILVFQLFSLLVSAQVGVMNLLTENTLNPVGLDVSQPRFTWQLNSDKRNITQAAYELKVTHGKTDVWLTGKVNSSQSVQVIYNGPALLSGTKYSWQVRVWDNEGKTSSVEQAGNLSDGFPEIIRLESKMDPA